MVFRLHVPVVTPVHFAVTSIHCEPPRRNLQIILYCVYPLQIYLSRYLYKHGDESNWWERLSVCLASPRKTVDREMIWGTQNSCPFRFLCDGISHLLQNDFRWYGEHYLKLSRFSFEIIQNMQIMKVLYV